MWKYVVQVNGCICSTELLNKKILIHIGNILLILEVRLSQICFGNTSMENCLQCTHANLLVM
jgi:hypothetical protein